MNAYFPVVNEHIAKRNKKVRHTFTSKAPLFNPRPSSSIMMQRAAD